MPSTKHTGLSFAAATLISAVTGPASAFELSIAGQTTLTEGGEIADFYSGDNTLVTTGSSSVQIFTLNADLTTTERATADFAAAFGPIELDGVSSTAVDPAGRGFGVASLIPGDDLNGLLKGKVGFFNTTTGAVLGTINVGFHPDSVKFSADGNTLYVANEGEFTSGGDTDAPGSISVIDLSGVANSTQTGNANNTGDFSFAGFDLSDTRINDTTATQLYKHVEPEFMAFSGDKVIVSLQENNALGVFDPTAKAWTDVFNLGTITNTIDATDKDKAAVIDDVIAGLPMPDAIASYSKGGKNYVVTANEGDARVDDGDLVKIKDLNLDPDTVTALNAIYGDYLDEKALGRLGFSSVDGDTDGDGDIDVPTAFGTRSFSIWNADTGALVADSGSLENFLLAEDPTIHNANDGGDPGEFDKRSDNKGPEPEGLDVILLEDGTVLLAIGMERQNGLILANITDPDNIELIDYINNRGEGLTSPESLTFVSAADSPNGQDLLIVGYEGVDGSGQGLGYYRVPEPASAALVAAGTLMVLRRRRNA